jgi:hypothetical protein
VTRSPDGPRRRLSLRREIAQGKLPRRRVLPLGRRPLAVPATPPTLPNAATIVGRAMNRHMSRCLAALPNRTCHYTSMAFVTFHPRVPAPSNLQFLSNRSHFSLFSNHTGPPHFPVTTTSKSPSPSKSTTHKFTPEPIPSSYEMVCLIHFGSDPRFSSYQ